jgi:hypothetical protein
VCVAGCVCCSIRCDCQRCSRGVRLSTDWA